MVKSFWFFNCFPVHTQKSLPINHPPDFKGAVHRHVHIFANKYIITDTGRYFVNHKLSFLGQSKIKSTRGTSDTSYIFFSIWFFLRDVWPVYRTGAGIKWKFTSPFFIKELETRSVYSRFIAFCISAWRSRLEPVIIEPAIIEPVIIEPVEYRCIRR